MSMDDVYVVSELCELLDFMVFCMSCVCCWCVGGNCIVYVVF